MSKFAFGLVLSLASLGNSWASAVTYIVDPSHTHPSFDVDHFGGLSVWRGNFKSTSGVIALDADVRAGSVKITIDPASVDFANDKLNEHVVGPEILDVAKFPTIIYEGRLTGFKGGVPSAVTGNLTLHGVTNPVNLMIDSFKCIEHPMLKKQVCGADASGSFNRADFGVNFGQQFGFKQEVLLRIQVEAIKAD